MAIGIHVARVGIFNVDSSGNRIDKNDASTTISQLRDTRQEALVIVDSNIPNTAGYPTIKRYLELEASINYKVQYMDMSFIVTYGS
jgi:hypothetical protein